MKKPYLLGIDIGTSALKCVIFNANGQEVVISRGLPDIIRLQPGWSELDSNILWQAIEKLIQEVTSNPTIADGRIEGIGITGTCCGSWLFDADVFPVRNAILWNDGRAADIMGQWQKMEFWTKYFEFLEMRFFRATRFRLCAGFLKMNPSQLKKHITFYFAKILCVSS